MRRIPITRESQGAEAFDLDGHRRRRDGRFDEPASFAPVAAGLPRRPNHLEGAAAFSPRRDLAALQLIEAAEAAMRQARTPDDQGPWSARAFTIDNLVAAAVEDAIPKARALGVKLLHEPGSGDAPQVIGEPHRLGQILGRLIGVALDARGVDAIRIGQSLRRQDHRLVADLTIALERGSASRDHVNPVVADEIAIDSALSLVLSPEVLAAAIGVGEPVRASRLAATFRLRLPLARVESGFGKSPAGPGDDDASALEGMRLLVVEDMDLNREMLRMLLDPFGCDLVEAADGREALAAIESGPCDVILMDLQLPQMDGFEAIRHIRARGDARAATPILAVSGRAMAADIAMAKAAGADGHLSKPYTTHDLVAAILKCRRMAEARKAT